MNSSPSPGGTKAPGTSRPENENDDPVGDNKPVGGSADPDAPEDDEEDADGTDDASNSGAVRTGNDGADSPRRSSDAGGGTPDEELPEGSDARPDDHLNAHHPNEDFPRRPERQPSPDSKLPQSGRG
ncbi:hypothetical protein ACQ859_05835 [Roseateles chitinivorans]|uniref:hypothetical protein n=1 Tax=Roseateles chitinivorans TaxID=2917965 RepID=UPI003D678A4A